MSRRAARTRRDAPASTKRRSSRTSSRWPTATACRSRPRCAPTSPPTRRSSRRWVAAATTSWCSASAAVPATSCSSATPPRRCWRSRPSRWCSWRPSTARPRESGDPVVSQRWIPAFAGMNGGELLSALRRRQCAELVVGEEAVGADAAGGGAVAAPVLQVLERHREAAPGGVDPAQPLLHFEGGDVREALVEIALQPHAAALGHLGHLIDREYQKLAVLADGGDLLAGDDGHRRGAVGRLQVQDLLALAGRAEHF